MEYWLSRAMQISCLERDDIEKLHVAEDRVGYCFPNWNIQWLLKCRSIKDFCDIPEDPGPQEAHRRRIANDLFKSVLSGEGITSDLTPMEVTHVHKMDWLYYESKSKIIWDHSSSGRSRRKVRHELETS